MDGIKLIAVAIVMLAGMFMLGAGIIAAPHLVTPGAILLIGAILCAELDQIIGQLQKGIRIDNERKQEP